MLEEYNLREKVAIVTGAGRGLGKAIALTLAEAGADIVIVSRTIEELEQTAHEVLQFGRKCLAMTADVTDIDQVNGLVEKTFSEFGKINILVNNAGVASFRALVPTPDLDKLSIAKVLPDLNQPINKNEWDTIWDTNVRGVFNCITVTVPFMIKQGNGKIINMISAAAVKSPVFGGVYPATKAAVANITRCLANELARFNINVNAIGPAFVRTAMMEKMLDDEEVRNRLLRSIPLRRFGNPREIGLLAVYLASDASNYMTGQCLFIDGGYTVA